MFFWICILLMVLSFFGYATINKGSNIKNVLYLFVGIMTLISGFRSHIGNDYDTYIMDFFQYSDYGDLIDIIEDLRREPTEAFLIYLLSGLGLEYQMLIFAYSVITFLLIIIILKDRFRSNYYLIFIGVITFALDYSMMWYSYSIIRQMVAELICLYSVKYLSNDESKSRFFFSVLLAMLFHYSAIVFILAYFVPRKMIKMKSFTIVLMITFAIYFF